MPRKRAPWMPEVPSKPVKRPTVFAVLPWRGDGRYRLDQATKVFLRRKAADDFAEKDATGTLCVRELDAPLNTSMASLIVRAFKESYMRDGPNLERQIDRPLTSLSKLRVVANPDDSREMWITNDREESYQVIADPVYVYRFIQQL